VQVASGKSLRIRRVDADDRHITGLSRCRHSVRETRREIKLTDLTNGSCGATNCYFARLAHLHRKRPQQERAHFHKEKSSIWQAQVGLNRMTS
jgi:hypothetical protein